MPAYNLVQSGGRAVPFVADFPATLVAEPAAEAAEAVALTQVVPSPHWAYSATATDNGTAGALSGEPGVVFEGEITQAVRVSVSNMVVEAGTIAPAAGDKYAIGVYKNSELVATMDNETVANEYVFDELDAEIVTAECDVIVDAVAPGDVVRIGLINLTEGSADIAVAEGGVVSIG